jgi:tetratricopeptide (TPR) repeat protein
MPKKQACKKQPRLETRTLAELCNFVVTCAYPFEDLKERIAERAFELCQKNPSSVFKQLTSLVAFFESLEQKNEENLRDLADACILIGEIYQALERHADGIAWLEKAVLIDDQYPELYIDLARSYTALGIEDKAIRSLEQEIRLAPGNYFPYLRLAELYAKENRFSDMESCLQKLLKRDPDNIQALHMLIEHYQREDPSADIHFLRSRLLSVTGRLNHRELLLWAFHLCQEGRYGTAVRKLCALQTGPDSDPALHLVCAHLYGLMKKQDEKAQELRNFESRTRAAGARQKSKLDEFRALFGNHATQELAKDMISA